MRQGFLDGGLFWGLVSVPGGCVSGDVGCCGGRDLLVVLKVTAGVEYGCCWAALVRFCVRGRFELFSGVGGTFYCGVSLSLLWLHYFFFVFVLSWLFLSFVRFFFWVVSAFWVCFLWFYCTVFFLLPCSLVFVGFCAFVFIFLLSIAILLFLFFFVWNWLFYFLFFCIGALVWGPITGRLYFSAWDKRSCFTAVFFGYCYGLLYWCSFMS
jgi:hypothetical protein